MMAAAELPPDPTRDFEVTVVVRNNRLKARRLQRGLSQKALASAILVSYPTLNRLEVLRDPPITKDGAWRDIALRLAQFFDCQPEDIFPPRILDVKMPKVSRLLDAHELAGIAGAEPARIEGPDVLVERAEEMGIAREMMDLLSERHRSVLVWRYGLDGEGSHSLDEVGERLGVGRERSRQIEQEALRELRERRAYADGSFSLGPWSAGGSPWLRMWEGAETDEWGHRLEVPAAQIVHKGAAYDWKVWALPPRFWSARRDGTPAPLAQGKIGRLAWAKIICDQHLAGIFPTVPGAGSGDSTGGQDG